MNYYELLGVNIDATEEEIKRAYKREIKKWHPDINKDEEAVSITMRLNEAKDTLLDKVKRMEYDSFINHKDNETYQKYTNVTVEKETAEDYNQYEDKLVTKWEYLRQYMQSDNISVPKKIVSYILVLLETFLCFILKYLIIGLSYLCFILSDLIIMLLRILSPLLLILVAYIVYIVVRYGFNHLLVNKYTEFYCALSYLIIYIIGIILPILGKKLISQKVFEFLYNKLDVYLFKKAVGYEN